ncbi:ABC transporter permease [Zobellella sp. DQSA1]|uniref:ABC transporter permease n=1 Tax=Zobellella sp. DQSA1 TaxID=3342386 RepID=UPI0035C1BB10
MQTRSSWQVTRNVWHAMFMREALARTMSDRFAAFWMLAEPVLFVMIMIGVRQLLGRVRVIAGADFIPWLLVGLMTFFLFRDGMTRAMGAINANKALFAYRQVKPVDTVLVRCALEGLLKTMVLVILLVGAALLGHDTFPDNPLGTLFIWGSVWLLGTGIGLVVSVGATLIPEVEKIVRMMAIPLMLISGAILPVNFLRHDIQEFVLYNPILHGIELIRLQFFHRYVTLSGVDLLYLYYWALGSIALGLLLHVKFSIRLKAQ